MARSSRPTAPAHWAPGVVEQPSDAASDDVLTGEAVALEVQPTGVLLRSAGVLIDLALAALLVIGAAFAVAQAVERGMLDPAAIPIVSIVVLVGVLIALPTAVETATRGRSLGKLAIGSRVVRTDGGAIGFRHAFIRATLGVFEIFFTAGVVAFVTGALSRRGQRLGDLAAGTFAQRERVPSLASAPGTLPDELRGWASIADVARLPTPLARRIAQFIADAPRMAPPARAQVAAVLVERASSYVAPVPSGSPEAVLGAIVAVRRSRAATALANEERRAQALVGTI